MSKPGPYMPKTRMTAIAVKYTAHRKGSCWEATIPRTVWPRSLMISTAAAAHAASAV